MTINRSFTYTDFDDNAIEVQRDDGDAFLVVTIGGKQSFIDLDDAEDFIKALAGLICG